MLEIEFGDVFVGTQRATGEHEHGQRQGTKPTRRAKRIRYQRYWRIGTFDGLERPGIQFSRSGILLCSGAADPNTTMVDL